MKQPTLKGIKVSSALVNITVEKSQVKTKTNKQGVKYTELTIGEHTINIDTKYVHPTKTNRITVGIRKNWDYSVANSDNSVQGVNLIEYYFDLKKQEKSSKKSTKK